jgi:hypothetical protein
MSTEQPRLQPDHPEARRRQEIAQRAESKRLARTPDEAALAVAKAA